MAVVARSNCGEARSRGPSTGRLFRRLGGRCPGNGCRTMCRDNFDKCSACCTLGRCKVGYVVVRTTSIPASRCRGIVGASTVSSRGLTGSLGKKLLEKVCIESGRRLSSHDLVELPGALRGRLKKCGSHIGRLLCGGKVSCPSYFRGDHSR